ncbi:Aste57867_15251 [Aphanomyces stellatus]|uniref:Aste57867_15251 protein n=1 Tax=Aphanomyces stellatus TaxID=120398 RepID=A0A485L3A7_9STRA|nr:hypothetical protein As57867_015195 [Aphanomyces stellatus]VFT92060.1 Aste57867_15251 [Aphanomyces stellatus]
MSPPLLVFANTDFNRAVLSKCPALESPYHPTWYLFNGHVHTIVAGRGSPSPKVKYERQMVPTADGGVVSIDWVVHPTKTYETNHPTLLIHHGAGGSSRDMYVRITAKALAAHGWRVVAMNMRGCGNTPLTTPRAANGFHTGDIRDVVAHLRQSVVPRGSLIGVGFCAGANGFVKYAGEEGPTCPLTAIVSISNPYSLVNLDAILHQSALYRYLYSGMVASAQKRQFFKDPQSAAQFEPLPHYDVAKIRKATTLRELDDLMSRRNEGYDSLADYYRDASCDQVMTKIRVPVLCISALDDPLCPPEYIPEDLCLRNEHFILAKTTAGGHLGFLVGDATEMWTSDVIAQYCRAVAGEQAAIIAEFAIDDEARAA